MSALVIGDDSGFPKRCFEYTFPDGHKHKFCVVWLEYPAFIWRRNRPDPGPIDMLEIEGVSRELLSDLQIIDTITVLSRKLSPSLAKGMIRALEEGVGAIQKALPSNVALSS